MVKKLIKDMQATVIPTNKPGSLALGNLRMEKTKVKLTAVDWLNYR
jgi:hypothetical protein